MSAPAAFAPTEARIETIVMKHGRCAVRILGGSRGVVQASITKRMNEVEALPGSSGATFETPFLREDGTWCSHGLTYTDQPQGAEA